MEQTEQQLPNILQTTRKILKAWYDDQYFGLLTYGFLRKGKSVYAMRVLAQVYGKKEVDSKGRLIHIKKDWEAWKKHMVWLPEDFIRKIQEVQDKGCQYPLIVWDDAGMWASHYRWGEEFSKALSDYVNAQGTNFASVMFTTPDPRWLLVHLRNIPGGASCKIYNNYELGKNWRKARAYRGWFSPDFKKSGAKAIYDDDFQVRLPDPVFLEYYKMRKGYNQIFIDKLRDTLATLPQRYQNTVVEKINYLEDRQNVIDKELPFQSTRRLFESWNQPVAKEG